MKSVQRQRTRFELRFFFARAESMQFKESKSTTKTAFRISPNCLVVMVPIAAIPGCLHRTLVRGTTLIRSPSARQKNVLPTASANVDDGQVGQSQGQSASSAAVERSHRSSSFNVQLPLTSVHRLTLPLKYFSVATISFTVPLQCLEAGRWIRVWGTARGVLVMRVWCFHASRRRHGGVSTPEHSCVARCAQNLARND
jgi:hypothetical protein